MPTARHCLLVAFLGATISVAAQTPSEDTGTTLHVQSSLVVVDVMVTDSSRNPVHGLNATDFTIREDGHPETVKSFEEHTADQAANAAQVSTRHFDPGIFTNEFTDPASGALNLILIDQLNSPEEVQKQTLDQVKQYLSNAPRGYRFAILVLNSTQLSMVQGFTSDRDLLLAALASKKAAPSFPTFLVRSAGSLRGTNLDAKTEPGITGQVKHQWRFELTLGSMNQLGRYLSQIPGRKNLLWFSADFPFSILPNGDVDTSPGYVDEFRETVNQLAHSQVSMFPIDARGLTTVNIRDDISPSGVTGGVSLVPDRDAFSVPSLLIEMRAIADATGGEAFANTNALSQAAARAVEAGSNYYTIAYVPANDKLNGKYRNIQVAVARKGLALAYRRGYYAADPNAHVAKENSKTSSPQGAQAAPYSAMQSAMVYGSPAPTQVLFSVSARQVSAAEEPSVYGNNQPSAAIKGPFHRYNVHFRVHLEDIVCDPTPQGPLYCAVEFVTRVFDANGAVINTQVNDIKENVKPDYFASLHRTGEHPELQYNQQISVPAKGDFYLRVGIHDLTSNRAGALEFPVSAVRSLAPRQGSSASLQVSK